MQNLHGSHAIWVHDFHWLLLGLRVTLLKIRHLQLKNLQDHCVRVDVISYLCPKELSHGATNVVVVTNP